MTALPWRARDTGAAAPTEFWDQLTRALIVVAVLLLVVTFTDYGTTWDEDVHNGYGALALNYYLTFFHDVRSQHWPDLINYGTAFDMTAALLNKFSPFGVYETRHLFNAVVGVLGLIGVARLGRSLGGPRAGFIAALFLLLTPNYYGQMFNNPKDIPFAVGMVWSVYYLVRLLPELPRPRAALVAKLGLATGLTMGVRVGGLMLFGYLGLLLLVAGLWHGIERRRVGATLAYGWTGFWRVWLPALLIAYAIMLFFWPWAQLSPFTNPLAALGDFSHQVYPYKTLFAGRYIEAVDLPWTYLPVYILLALPELVLLLLVAAPLAALWHLRHGLQAAGRDLVIGRFLLGFSILFPIAYAIAIHAVLFDGMRHFIFVLPLIAATAALLADRALTALATQNLRRWAYGALALYGLAHVTVMARLHPDEYVYYNAFIGGTEGAQGLFKLDYWANSYAAAVRGLEQHLRAEYGADFMDHDFTVAVCGPPISATNYFPPNFIYLSDHQQADFFIAFTKDDCDKSLPGRVIYRVKRMDTLLSVVIDRRAILAAGPASPIVTGQK